MQVHGNYCISYHWTQSHTHPTPQQNRANWDEPRNFFPPFASSLEDNTRASASAVLMGTVDFSITILGELQVDPWQPSGKEVVPDHYSYCNLSYSPQVYRAYDAYVNIKIGEQVTILHKITQQKIPQKFIIHVSTNCWSGHPRFLIWPSILLRLAYCEMVRPTLSMNLKSAARPLPRPDESLVQRFDIRNPSGDIASAMSSRQVFEVTTKSTGIFMMSAEHLRIRQSSNNFGGKFQTC